jgi:beta-mannanase
MAEFNGFWYPWSRDPREFVSAWRHMWNVFHAVGADNVTWVWSFQVNSNAQPGPWEQKIAQYWPGSRYVDVLGMAYCVSPRVTPCRSTSVSLPSPISCSTVRR